MIWKYWTGGIREQGILIRDQASDCARCSGYNWWEMDYETEETADINDLIQVRQGEKGDAVYTNNVQNDYDKKDLYPQR